jgi:hypothetical protein
MSCAAIKMQIAAKESDIAKTQAALKAHQEHLGYILSVLEQEIYELNLKLQLAEAEADEGWRSRPAEAEDDEGWNVGLADRQAASWEAKEEEPPIEGWGGEERFNAAPVYPPRTQGTKLKWILEPETYRVAIVKKDGILEVKRVTEGGGYCHDYMTCKCTPCGYIALSRRLGAPNPPWQPGAPLTKTFFATEAAWRSSLPDGGQITVTEPRISGRALRALCMKPLKATTDALQLKELEERFPGATMVLTTHKQYEIRYNPDSFYGDIYCEKEGTSAPYFWHFGGEEGKPHLMAEWLGLYINLSHLF